MDELKAKRLAALEKAREARKGSKRQSKREKLTAHAQAFTKMRQTFPKMALPVISRAEGGSLTAAVQLMCLECSSWVRQEVRDCVITNCPLYPFRPYQKLTGGNPNDRGGSGVKPLEYPSEHVPRTSTIS